MYWFPYLSLPNNLIKALIENRNLRQLGCHCFNLRTDAMLSLYFRLYKLNSGEA